MALTLATSDGLVSPPDLQALDVPAGTTVAADVSALVAATPAAVRVVSEAGPVLASGLVVDALHVGLRPVGRVRELAWTGAAGAAHRPGAADRRRAGPADREHAAALGPGRRRAGAGDAGADRGARRRAAPRADRRGAGRPHRAAAAVDASCRPARPAGSPSRSGRCPGPGRSTPRGTCASAARPGRCRRSWCCAAPRGRCRARSPSPTCEPGPAADAPSARCGARRRRPGRARAAGRPGRRRRRARGRRGRAGRRRGPRAGGGRRPRAATSGGRTRSRPPGSSRPRGTAPPAVSSVTTSSSNANAVGSLPTGGTSSTANSTPLSCSPQRPSSDSTASSTRSSKRSPRVWAAGTRTARPPTLTSRGSSGLRRPRPWRSRRRERGRAPGAVTGAG